MPTPFSRGYFAGDDGTGPVHDFTLVNPKVAWTAGGMVSTLGDIEKWGRVLARGTLLSPRLQRAAAALRALPQPGAVRRLRARHPALRGLDRA